jgi:hypothetical protein
VQQPSTPQPALLPATLSARQLERKEAFIRWMRSRGLEPDARQEGRSLVFATFAVTSAGRLGNWIFQDDRADLMGIFLPLP